MINIGLLKNFSRVKKYAKGNVFDSAGEIYVILKGEIGLFTNYRRLNEEMLARIGPGDFFGETAELIEKRKITVAALSDVFVLPVNKGTAALFAKGEPDIAAELIKAMYDRLDHINADYEVLSGHPWSEARPMPQGEAEEQAPDEPESNSVEAENSSEAAPAAFPAADVSAPAEACTLFPEGHGSYQLPLQDQDAACLMIKSVKCPLCKTEFKSQRVRNSKLILDHTDSDMRNHYAGVEPLYYDVITCPRCLYSALSETFEKPDKGADVLKDLQPLKSSVTIRTGQDLDTFSLFAGYYLALLCAPKCFVSHTLATAKLYLKLSRIYQDCGDSNMEKEIARKALDAYIRVYEKGDLQGSQEQQLCLIIGELSYKVDDLKNALEFLFKAKNNPEGSPILKTHAEDRIFEIRGLEA